jgi:membrane protease YdiL (CAAX protease family)
MASKLNRFSHFPLVRIIVGLFVCILVIIIGQISSQAFLKTSTLEKDYKDILTGIWMAVLVLAAYILLFRSYENRAISELSLKRFWVNAGLGFLIGIALQSLVILIIFLNGGYQVISVNPITYLLPAFAIGITSAIFEEVLFRGILFRITEASLGTIWALVISSVIFGGMHLANKSSSLYSAFSIAIEAGLLLGVSYVYAKNLWMPILLHFSWNFAEGGIYGAYLSGNVLSKSLITSRFSGSEWISGGTFGPENSLQAIILGLIAAAIIFRIAYKQGKIMQPYWKSHKS